MTDGTTDAIGRPTRSDDRRPFAEQEPAGAGTEDEDDPAERGSVGYVRSTTLRLRPFPRQGGLGLPEVGDNAWVTHDGRGLWLPAGFWNSLVDGTRSVVVCTFHCQLAPAVVIL